MMVCSSFVLTVKAYGLFVVVVIVVVEVVNYFAM